MAQGYKVAFFQRSRFTKEFAVSWHQPLGKTSDYVGCIEKADHERLAKLVKSVGMPLQQMVYLSWKREGASSALAANVRYEGLLPESYR